ncbi:MAG TPA: hypothetical protein VHL53_19140 [Acidimicrobiia bacterium]|nr:hypothetical protein [Acidimicrobiia bacterium]
MTTPGSPAGRPGAPVPRPTWLKITSLLAIAGAVVWPVLAFLGLLGTIPANTVLDLGIATAGLAYLSIRRIKADRARAGWSTDPGDDDHRRRR